MKRNLNSNIVEVKQRPPVARLGPRGLGEAAPPGGGAVVPGQLGDFLGGSSGGGFQCDQHSPAAGSLSWIRSLLSHRRAEPIGPGEL